MRIGIVGHHVAPIRPPFAGGVESHTHYLARWLTEAGHEVTLFALEGSAIGGVRVVPLQMRPRISDTARGDVSMPPRAFMDAHCAYQSLLVELHGHCPFDVVHLQTLHYLPVAMAALLPVPAVLTLHCPPTPWLEAALLARTGGRLWPTAVSEYTATQWRHVAPTARVIPNGIDPVHWPAGPGGRSAFWSGRIVPEKAPHLAIQAARRAGLELRVAGPIYDEAYFREFVEPELGPGVTYLGHLGHADLARAVGGSGVALVTPAWEEPFGLVAAEAMTTGTPVAGFARGGLPDVVGSGGVLVAPGDVDALADAARAALALDRRAVRQAAVSRLGIDAMGAAYLGLYERALRGRQLVELEAA